MRRPRNDSVIPGRGIVNPVGNGLSAICTDQAWGIHIRYSHSNVFKYTYLSIRIRIRIHVSFTSIHIHIRILLKCIHIHEYFS